MGLVGNNRNFLDSLGEADRAELLGLGGRHRYASGQVLLHEGERGDFLLVIVRGWGVVSTETKRGSRVILALRGPGELVGDLAVLDRNPRSATVTALGPVEAGVLPGDRFRGFLAKRPHATAAIMSDLGARLRSSDGERRALATATVMARLAARIAELAEHTGVPGPDGVGIEVRLPQHDLAAAVGATRESVAKALRILREQGVIRTGQRSLLVLRLDLLRQIRSNDNLDAA